jgi:hypothetical protein
MLRRGLLTQGRNDLPGPVHEVDYLTLFIIQGAMLPIQVFDFWNNGLTGNIALAIIKKTAWRGRKVRQAFPFGAVIAQDR